MTDGPGHRPRLSTAALLAPAAAAVLAGSLSWAAGHPPAGAPLTKSAVTASPTPGQVDAERARQSRDLQRLREQVQSLRAELKDLKNAENNPHPSGTRGSNATSRATTDPKPARTTPPPVHATTGAS